MDQRTFLRIAGGVFALVAVLHAARLVWQWDVVIAGWVVPSWVSWVALLVAGALAAIAVRLSRRS